MIRKDFSLTCHTERSEVSHNAESTMESKRDFSLTLKMTKGKRTQNDKERDFSFATQTQNDK